MDHSKTLTSNRQFKIKSTRPKNQLLFILLLGALATPLVGCQITEDDVHLWAKKSMGPTKLVAVLQHDKYEQPLRVEAAITLVNMKPRNGRLVGLIGNDDFSGLFKALAEITAVERTPIVDALVPQLVAPMVEVRKKGELDSSYHYKDAAFGLLKHKGDELVKNPASQKKLRDALIHWSNHNFETRLDNTSQIYGMGQVLEYLNADGVRGLTPQVTSTSKKLAELSSFIKKLGDEKTRDEASARLVAVANFVDSQDWLREKSPAVQAANAKNPAYKKITPEQFQQQMQNYQQEELFRVFAAMKNLGMKPSVNYLLKIAQDSKQSIARRQNAIAGLEGNLDRKDQKHASIMLKLLANDQTPDEIRGLAIARIGELSRVQVADELFKLFKNDRWQVRASAAALILRMSTAEQLDEFMKNLGKVRHMALNETFSYGGLIGKLKGGQPKELIAKYAAKGHPANVRLAALGYYYLNGDNTDLPTVEAFSQDRQRAPNCSNKDENCEWSCQTSEEGKLIDHEIKTVGQYVQYCIVPNLSSRISAADLKKRSEEKEEKEAVKVK